MRALLLQFSLGLAVCVVALPGLAQTPAPQPADSHRADTRDVHPSATVEVLEDPSQVDEVIARMKRRPEVKPPPMDNSAGSGAGSLQTERPALPDDTPDKEVERPATKAEKRAREIERRRHHLR